jgi:hypothetical protein
MKRLVHDTAPLEEKRQKTAARPFAKLAAAAALALATTIGCATTGIRWNEYYEHYPSSISRQYGTQTVRVLPLGSHRLEVMFLNDSIASLESTMTPLRSRDLHLQEGQSADLVTLPNVVLRQTRTEESVGALSFLFLKERGADGPNYTAAVFFPASLDTQPQLRSLPGLRTAPSIEFAQVFREVTGQELEHVHILVERSSDFVHGGDFISAHVIGVDAQGRPLGQYRGGIVSFGMTYYPLRDELRSGLGIIVEYGGPDPVTGVHPAPFQR